MTHRLLAVLLFSLTAALAACNPSTSDAAAPEYAISVDGMTCGSCVAAVEHAISSIDGVVDCEVLLEEGRAILHAEDSAAVDRAVAAVNGIEFEAARLDGDQQDG